MMRRFSRSFLLGGALIWLFWQPLPESGFFYKIQDGQVVKRVQGFFRSSQVEGAGLRPVDGGYHRFVSWVAISWSNALKGEPTGICFFDDDGDFSGFLPLSGDVSGLVESIYADHRSIDLTLSGVSLDNTMSFKAKDGDITWPHRGCYMSIKKQKGVTYYE